MNGNSQEKSILKPNYNCWRVEQATYASVIIDVANYYRALHYSISKAKHSVFIIGWDLDSRIALLRGDDAKPGIPITLYDLILSKAKEKPELQIYLNDWDYSLLFFSEREFMPALKWRATECPNIHFETDSIVPFHGSHHQKLIIVDDEVAYSGGIDIGLYRWDTRDHLVDNPHRLEPAGKLDKEKFKSYQPNHDIQICLAGPAAQALAELARQRWLMATDFEAIPQRIVESEGLPPTWPEQHPPEFQNISTGISLTFPPVGDAEPIQQVEKIYIDEIGKAEKFIYIENQYLASDLIASALNQKLKNNPDIRILLVSSKDPAGILEESVLWTKRIRFKKIIRRGGVKHRVAVTYPLTTGKEDEFSVHVHSKIMIVDDKFLHVGSANLNNRSMMLDSECDIVLVAEDEQSRSKIADIRNDLIREHTGMEKEAVQKLVDGRRPIKDFLIDVTDSRQHLRMIRDPISKYSIYTIKTLMLFGEPTQSSLPEALRAYPKTEEHSRFPHKRVAVGILMVMLAILLLTSWNNLISKDIITSEGIRDQIENLAGSSYAIPAVILIFIIGGLIFIPLTVMIAATAASFGIGMGLFLALAGSLSSALVTFFIGYLIGEKVFHNYAHLTFLRISNRINNTGVTGIAILRMIPLAPYTLVNMILGVTNIKLLPYLLGTFLGLLPGTVAMCLLGDSIAEIWRHPTMNNLLYVGLGIITWLAIITIVHRLVSKFQNKRHNMPI